MKRWVWTAACLIAGAGAAAAQDSDKKVDELKREFERSMKGLQERFDKERARLEKEFKAAQEKLLGKRAEPAEKRSLDEMVQELLKRVESLEKRLEKEAPALRALPRVIPHDFHFENFGEKMPDEWRKWMEQMPKWKGNEDFKFEFRKLLPKEKEEGEKKERKKDKKDKEDEDRKEF